MSRPRSEPCTGAVCQRTTADDRIGDVWRRKSDPSASLTVVGKFNDWCLEMSGGSHPRGVFPLWWLDEAGYERGRR